MVEIILGYILVAIICFILGMFGCVALVMWMCDEAPESVIGWLKDNALFVMNRLTNDIIQKIETGEIVLKD